jgi:hypothetical protein
MRYLRRFFRRGNHLDLTADVGASIDIYGPGSVLIARVHLVEIRKDFTEGTTVTFRSYEDRLTR